jgi:hypothetical protein
VLPAQWECRTACVRLSDLSLVFAAQCCRTGVERSPGSVGVGAGLVMVNQAIEVQQRVQQMRCSLRIAELE